MGPGEETDMTVVVEVGNRGGRYSIPARRFENQGAVVAIGGQVLIGGESSKFHVKNVGDRRMEWKTDWKCALSWTMLKFR